MQIVFTVALPFFALILCGFAARRFNALEEASVIGLNRFVFYFALPALLFFKMAETPAIALFDWRFVAAYSGGGLFAFAACVLAGRLLFRSPLAVNGLQGMAAAFPNVGYIGLPLVIAVFGDAAALPAVIVVVADHLILFPLATAMIEAGAGKGTSLARLLRNVALGLARNPLIVASLAGVLWSLGPLAMPVPVQAFGDLLGAAAAPCALFALGATLVGRPISENAGEVGMMTLAKLVVHPAATAVLAYPVLALDPMLANIAIIDAALPIAANVFVLAGAYGVYTARVSTAILVSTALSVFTVSALLVLLAPA